MPVRPGSRGLSVSVSLLTQQRSSATAWCPTQKVARDSATCRSRSLQNSFVSRRQLSKFVRLPYAAAQFRAIPFDALRATDFDSNAPACDGPAMRSHRAHLGVNKKHCMPIGDVASTYSSAHVNSPIHSPSPIPPCGAPLYYHGGATPPLSPYQVQTFQRCFTYYWHA